MSWRRKKAAPAMVGTLTTPQEGALGFARLATDPLAGENKLGNLCWLNKDVLEMIFDGVMIYQFTLVQLASMGKLENVKQKIEKLGTNLDGKKLQRAINNAARHGHLAVVRYLFTVLDQEPYKNIREITKEVALELALKNRQANVAEYLLRDYHTSICNNVMDAFFFLSANGYDDMLRLLVNNSVDLFAKNNVALTAAVDYGHMNVVKYLLEELPEDQRAKVLDRLSDACARAAAVGDLDMVRYLLEKDTQGRIDRYEAMNDAASQEKLDVLKFLLDYRPNDRQSILGIIHNVQNRNQDNPGMLQMLKDAYCATLNPNS